jgi:hypothetical protein
MDAWILDLSALCKSNTARRSEGSFTSFTPSPFSPDDSVSDEDEDEDEDDAASPDSFLGEFILRVCCASDCARDIDIDSDSDSDSDSSGKSASGSKVSNFIWHSIANGCEGQDDELHSSDSSPLDRLVSGVLFFSTDCPTLKSSNPLSLAQLFHFSLSSQHSGSIGPSIGSTHSTGAQQPFSFSLAPSAL